MLVPFSSKSFAEDSFYFRKDAEAENYIPDFCGIDLNLTGRFLQ
jgi:hypothetical protein